MCWISLRYKPLQLGLRVLIQLMYEEDDESNTSLLPKASSQRIINTLLIIRTKLLVL